MSMPDTVSYSTWSSLNLLSRKLLYSESLDQTLSAKICLPGFTCFPNSTLLIAVGTVFSLTGSTHGAVFIGELSN